MFPYRLSCISPKDTMTPFNLDRANTVKKHISELELGSLAHTARKNDGSCWFKSHIYNANKLLSVNAGLCSQLQQTSEQHDGLITSWVHSTHAITAAAATKKTRRGKKVLRRTAAEWLQLCFCCCRLKKLYMILLYPCFADFKQVQSSILPSS